MSDIDVKDLKKGDRFCEFSGYNMAVRLTAKKDATKDGEYWNCVAEDDRGNPVQLGCHEKYPHYGPKLYRGNEVPYARVKYL
jgi:hypothetical protein